jgi:hypothetical protein
MIHIVRVCHIAWKERASHWIKPLREHKLKPSYPRLADMNNPTGIHPDTHNETITRLRSEIAAHAGALKSCPEWVEIERIYRALRTVEELSGAGKSTLEQLLGLNVLGSTPDTEEPRAKVSQLDLGEQLESEEAAEIEKGS